MNKAVRVTNILTGVVYCSIISSIIEFIKKNLHLYTLVFSAFKLSLQAYDKK
jgi:hypothetical protein